MDVILRKTVVGVVLLMAAHFSAFAVAGAFDAEEKKREQALESQGVEAERQKAKFKKERSPECQFWRQQEKTKKTPSIMPSGKYFPTIIIKNLPHSLIKCPCLPVLAKTLFINHYH